jgi:preprotein translocase subunit SecD
LALATSGCLGGKKEPTQAASHEPEARSILQFAAEVGPGEEATAREYEHEGEKLRLGALRAFEIKTVNVCQDDFGLPALEFEIADQQKEAFRQWTAGLVGRRLVVLVEGNVVTAAVVQSALPGRGIVGFGAQHRTQAEVRELAERIRAQGGGHRGR